MKTTATSISRYLADIGRKGGRKSRRHLSFDDARDMVRVREAGAIFARSTPSVSGTCVWLLRTPPFHRAIITADKQQLKIEWAQDSAFRFFPVQSDAQCGYRLHDADAATNIHLTIPSGRRSRGPPRSTIETNPLSAPAFDMTLTNEHGPESPRT